MPLLSKFLTQARLAQVSGHMGRKILDIGCGYGELLEHLGPDVDSVVLVDRSPERQPRVEEKLAKQSVRGRFVQGDIEQGNFALTRASFDTVVMAALLEHLKLPGDALREIQRLLEPGGRLLLTTPTPLGGWIHKITSYLGLTYREAAKEHERFYGKRSLTSLLELHGFEVQVFKPFLFGLNQFVVARKKG
jgi:ubiquinone/menaquinone biosynthesis C-methylase UbiE